MAGGVGRGGGGGDAGGMLDPGRIYWGDDAVGMLSPRRRFFLGEDSAGMPDSWGNDAGGILILVAPHSSAPARKGYTTTLSPGNFTLGCRWLVEGNGPVRSLKSALKQGERTLPAPFPQTLSSSPAGTGISGLCPELLKALWVPVLLCYRRR